MDSVCPTRQHGNKTQQSQNCQEVVLAVQIFRECTSKHSLLWSLQRHGEWAATVSGVSGKLCGLEQTPEAGSFAPGEGMFADNNNDCPNNSRHLSEARTSNGSEREASQQRTHHNSDRNSQQRQPGQRANSNTGQREGRDDMDAPRESSSDQQSQREGEARQAGEDCPNIATPPDNDEHGLPKVREREQQHRSCTEMYWHVSTTCQWHSVTGSKVDHSQNREKCGEICRSHGPEPRVTLINE